MRIKVLQNYGGVRTNEKRILPGVYESDDERLFGLSDYLIDNGYATVVSEDESLETIDHVHDEIDGDVISTLEHDALMKRKGRPQSIPHATLEELRDKYEFLAGESADGRWSVSTLEEKIADLE